MQIQAPASDSPDGIEVPIDVTFEPSSRNESRGIMTIQNPEGGTYQCYMIGSVLSPQPKGPFKATGKGASIEFKNPFYEPMEFILRIDNPNFGTNAKNPLKIDGKKTINIPVSYKGNKDLSKNGRLMVSTGDSLTWTFYVEGE